MASTSLSEPPFPAAAGPSGPGGLPLAAGPAGHPPAAWAILHILIEVGMITFLLNTYLSGELEAMVFESNSF